MSDKRIPKSANSGKPANSPASNGSNYVQVRGAREHNLKGIDVEFPRNSMVVFTGVSGSGKSSLAFSVIHAETERRYLESVAPYARRLFNQAPVAAVDAIFGMPPSIALQQRRSTPSARSTVGSMTTLGNLIRMLYSRAGKYAPGQKQLEAEDFSTNTPSGACPQCQGVGRTFDATEASMVPDRTLTIREKAVAAWPSGWQGQNLRDMLVSRGIDIDKPWRELSARERKWILFTEERPAIPVYIGMNSEEIRLAISESLRPSYLGTFIGARRHLLQTFATSKSETMRRRASRYLVSAICPTCLGKRLTPEALRVTVSGLDISQMGTLPLSKLFEMLASWSIQDPPEHLRDAPERALAAAQIADECIKRLHGLLGLGLGHLSLDRISPSLSSGELQRIRIATQLHANLFGVAYVLDEPSAGLHPADTRSLLKALKGLRDSGNSLIVVEHSPDVIREADWIVDFGPGPGIYGGQVLHSGPVDEFRNVPQSATSRYLCEAVNVQRNEPRSPTGWLRLSGIYHNNLRGLNAVFPLGVLSVVTGVSGAGKSSLVSQALVQLLGDKLSAANIEVEAVKADDADPLEERLPSVKGKVVGGGDDISCVVLVDQKPIGRTPRSNLATYTGIFDRVRSLFAATPLARKKKLSAGYFSFNVDDGRCERCRGEGQVAVELLFLPSVYTSCPECGGTRYKESVLKIKYNDLSISDVLDLTVDAALKFFGAHSGLVAALGVLHDLGLGYLKLGQPAPQLSGGEAQRIKLATEILRSKLDGVLFIMDEPSSGLHPQDVDNLFRQLNKLVDRGATIILVEHDMRAAACCDWVIDMGPGAGVDGGSIVAAGTPAEVAAHSTSATAPFLTRALIRTGNTAD